MKSFSYVSYIKTWAYHEHKPVGICKVRYTSKFKITVCLNAIWVVMYCYSLNILYYLQIRGSRSAPVPLEVEVHKDVSGSTRTSKQIPYQYKQNYYLHQVTAQWGSKAVFTPKLVARN